LKNGQTEFLLPLAGSIKQAIKKFLTISDEGGDNETVDTLSDEIIGDTFYFTRQPDGKSSKYGGKPMFLFDVRRLKA
jgi:hypothetical protein